MEKNYKSFKEILKEYLPNLDADYELLKIAMRKLGKEKAVKAYREVFDGWITK